MSQARIQGTNRVTFNKKCIGDWTSERLRLRMNRQVCRTGSHEAPAIHILLVEISETNIRG